MSWLRTPPTWWYEGAPVPLWADALSHVYARFTAATANRARARAQRVGIPIIVIGNLIAGGAGKTPLAIAIVERLKEWGWTPGVATRGYGRENSRQALWATPGSDARDVGDEPLLIAQRTDVPVRVDARRADAAILLRDAGCNIIVCDDGLQHYKLARDIEIEVIDGRRGYGNGRLIPAGPLREPRSRSNEFAFRIVNIGNDSELSKAEQADAWHMDFVPGDAVSLVSGASVPLATFAGRTVHAVAGIGDPQRFFGMLGRLGIQTIPHSFPDHHVYWPADLQFDSGIPVLMTDKDAVKCTAFARHEWYRIPVEARLPPDFWVSLKQRLDSLKTGETDK